MFVMLTVCIRPHHLQADDVFSRSNGMTVEYPRQWTLKASFEGVA